MIYFFQFYCSVVLYAYNSLSGSGSCACFGTAIYVTWRPAAADEKRKAGCSMPLADAGAAQGGDDAFVTRRRKPYWQHR